MSRRDDLETLGYIMIYLFKGELPWQNLNSHNMSTQFQKIKESKLTTSLETLCKGCPKEFKRFIKYIKNLGFS